MTRIKKRVEKTKAIEEDYKADPEAMIQSIDLRKYYNITEGITVKALDGVNITVKEGEFVSVMGPSGSGKTTLLNMIGALDNPSGGAVFISGENIAYMNDEERTNLRLRKIGFIFQFYNLVPVLTAFENVELPMLFAERSEREIDTNVNKFLNLVGLNDRKDFLPSELSGGEQQRVAIARALSNEPAIIIADEPTGELDTKMGMEIVQLLRDLNKELNQTILMVTHDPSVGALADRTLRMRDGKILDSKLN
jgi:ABC-type lipoprotein export system ATPase subunit